MNINVVIAIYNPDINFFNSQLKSIIDQTKVPDKIVLVDDKSDNYFDLKTSAENLLNQSNINYIFLENEKNMGINYTFRRGLAQINEGVCFISDQDDIWNKNKIEHVMDVYNKKDRPLLIINNCHFYRDGKIDNSLTKLEIINELTGTDTNFVAGCCTAIDSKIIHFVNLGLFNFLNYDEQLHSIANLLDSRLVLKKSLQLYRRHSQNNSDSIVNYPLVKRQRIKGKLYYVKHHIKKLFFYNYIKMEDDNIESLISSIKKYDQKKLEAFDKLFNLLLLIKNYRNKQNILFFTKGLAIKYYLLFIRLLLGILILKIFKYEKK